MLGVPGSIPGQVLAPAVQLVRVLAGLGGWCHAWGPRFNPRPGLGSVG